jgi:hypothetical protein
MYVRESHLRATASALRSDIRAGEAAVGLAVGFRNAVGEQARRLSHIGLFVQNNDTTKCPLCHTQLDDPPASVSELNESYETLSNELAAVNRDRPKLDEYLIAKRDELQSVVGELAEVRRQIRQLIPQVDLMDEQIGANYTKGRVIGRISLYLDTLAEDISKTDASLDELRRRVEELESQVDLEAKRERLEVEQTNIASIATRIMQELPFEEEYRDASIYFLARSIECGIITPARRIPMRQVGSDENYLTLHVALLVAFHRFFKNRSSPVPGVILCDQLSRPYYPPEERPGEIVFEDDTEAGALRRYFKFLFKEAREQGDLQVIVLEHAFFKSDPEFVKSVRYRWNNDLDKLIPADWPRR